MNKCNTLYIGCPDADFWTLGFGKTLLNEVEETIHFLAGEMFQ